LCYRNSIVAAGAVITQNTVASGTIWAGVPAKKVKTLINLILLEKSNVFPIIT
jgi:carbonic anhydrase/acetyltransferase-like protein (isoleucine patch superfamily)